jgi:phospholipase C
MVSCGGSDGGVLGTVSEGDARKSGSASAAGALNDVVVVPFENRSLDNVLGHLYGPGDRKAFARRPREGVEQSDPGLGGARRRERVVPYTVVPYTVVPYTVVPYTVATDMDSPNPDSGEEWYHTNTQLCGVLDEHNRFRIGEDVSEPWNAPESRCDAHDERVRRRHQHVHRRAGPSADRRGLRADHDRVHAGAAAGVERDRARVRCLFDHWFSEVPSQTFMNRMGQGVIEHARKLGVELPAHADEAAVTSALILEVLRQVASHYFPRLAPETATVAS